jgi:hypothetical protein
VRALYRQEKYLFEVGSYRRKTPRGFQADPGIAATSSPCEPAPGVSRLDDHLYEFYGLTAEVLLD